MRQFLLTHAKKFGSPGPPVDAVNALHRYRDAILVRAGGDKGRRPVVRGAALFPYPGAESKFQQNSLFSALQTLGIGAIPFLPTKRLLLNSWLESLLTESPSSLAEPGPPFAGLQAKAIRAAAEDESQKGI